MFLLYDWFDVEVFVVLLCYVEYSCEIFDVVFDISEWIVEDLFVLYVVCGDCDELWFDGECVMLILEVELVVCVFVDVGLIVVGYDEVFGGMCLLKLVEVVLFLFF